MLFGVLATRFVPPLSALITLTTVVIVFALGKQVASDFQSTTSADQLHFKRFEAASDQKKTLARVIFWIGIFVFGAGIGIVLTYIRYPEDVSAIPNPLVNGSFLAGIGLLVAGFPKFVMFSK
jgi:hypothetical protein